MELHQLIESINQTADYFQREAVKQVNISLTLRNWVIGCYLYEYEQRGQDRAVYGTKLYATIAARLKRHKNLSKTQLYRYKDFYLAYPQIFPALLGKLQNTDSQYFMEKIPQMSLDFIQDEKLPYNKPELLIDRLSFSHFLELLKAETPLKRIFYEVEAIKNNWTIRDLERAINTSLYERTGLSTDKAAVIAKIKQGAVLMPNEIIRDPYILEFLGLDEKMRALSNTQRVISRNRFLFQNTCLTYQTRKN